MTTIVHTTELAQDEGVAFAHAVALARAAGAQLVALHANASDAAVTEMLDAAEVLAAWGAEPDAVDFTKRIHNCCDDPVETVLDALRTITPDLVVAATHRRSALARMFAGSAAEALAHNLRVPTLLVPADVRGFVDRHDGAIDLHRILVPLGDTDESQTAVRAAARLAELADATEVEFALLHVGQAVSVATEPLAARPGWTVRRIGVTSGTVESVIAAHAAEACVIVMATRGHDSLGDVVKGSRTDRVLHRVECPVLSVGVQ